MNPVKLTKREAEILGYLAQGVTSKEIAATLFLSKRTVDFHLANIYAKLSVKNRLQAFHAATSRGLMSF